MPDDRRSPWLERLQKLALAGAIGLGAGFLVSLGNAPEDRWISLLYGGLAGLGIYLIARGLSLLLRVQLHRLTGGWRVAAYSALFFVSGVTSWILAGFLINIFLGINIRVLSGEALGSIGITAGLAIAIGLAFSSFERMKMRLAESVARLKEVEFAERELQLARDLQRRLLPPAEIEGEGYRVAARNLAARVVAGDFYDVFRLTGGGGWPRVSSWPRPRRACPCLPRTTRGRRP